MSEGPRYVRGSQAWSLDDAETVKVILRDPTFSKLNERIWVARHGGEMALMNDAVSFDPFPTWGMIFPWSTDFSVEAIKSVAPNDSEFVLHPEIWDKYAEEGYFDADGRLSEKYKEEHRGSTIDPGNVLFRPRHAVN